MKTAGFMVFDREIFKFDNKPFDLAITDMLMPCMNSGSFLQYIRKSRRKFTLMIGYSGSFISF